MGPFGVDGAAVIYRGQKYGEPVGEWWTTSLAEAIKFAMSAGGTRTWVVIGFDESLDEDEWLRPFVVFDRSSRDPNLGDWLRIPLDNLREHWRGIGIIQGAISIEPMPESQ